MLLEAHTLDVVCLQETWLPPAAVPLCVPGFQVVEHRRGSGKRGGIATLVRKGINIVQHKGNEVA